MKIKIKYVDLVRPQMKAIAENIRQDAETATGKRFKVKDIKFWSDEMRIELKEIPNEKAD